MLYFKSCPRCRIGTVELATDSYGAYLSCLNCGFSKSGNMRRNFTSRRTPMATNSARLTPPSRSARVA